MVKLPKVGKAFLCVVVCVAALSSCSESEWVGDWWVGEWQTVAMSFVALGQVRGDDVENGETYTFREDGSFEIHERDESGIFLVTGSRFMFLVMKEDEEDKWRFGTWMRSKNHLLLEYLDDSLETRFILKRM